jgi:hypothetical protein
LGQDVLRKFPAVLKFSERYAMAREARLHRKKMDFLFPLYKQGYLFSARIELDQLGFQKNAEQKTGRLMDCSSSREA